MLRLINSHKIDPAFSRKLEAACRQRRTKNEIFEQKVSFIYSSVNENLASPQMSKAEIRERLSHGLGTH